MKATVKRIGNHEKEFTNNDGTILFSYSTPVAYYSNLTIPPVAFKTEERFSTTTTRHINKAATRWGVTFTTVPQDFIENLATFITETSIGDYETIIN